jgi:FkbM family methyltransferase
MVLPKTTVWVQVQSGLSKGMWMNLSLPQELRLWRGDHELIVQHAILAAVHPGAVVYDIGAHAGSIALGVARLVGPSGRVVAFEADPQNAECLTENASRNHLMASLQVVQSAVWSYTTTKICFRSGGRRRSHGGVETDGQCPVLGGGDTINVSAVTLDDFLAKGGPVPQLVKIDVEGGEYEVLRGGTNLFSKLRPLIIAEIHHEPAAKRIASWLVEHQYLGRWVMPSEGFPCCLFARPEQYRGADWMWKSESHSQPA